MKKLKVLNLRLGFATNSSSLHSMIQISGAKDLYASSGEGQYGEFGWDLWTAVSVEDKSKYLAGILWSSMLGYMGETKIPEVLAELLPGVSWCGSYESAEAQSREWNYIDHQSVFSLPTNWEADSIDREFFSDLKRFVLHDDLLILGGNDNIDGIEDIHPILREYAEKDIFPFAHLDAFDGGRNVVSRKDPIYGFWTLFNRNSGTKMRFRFDEVAKSEIVRPDLDRWWLTEKKDDGYWKDPRSSLPELCDISITSFCTKGCAYCYQESSEQGSHADLAHILEVIDVLAEHHVFEVAIGGGDPVEHPEFEEIILYCQMRGVVPNFSTRSLKWMTEPEAQEIVKNIGGFAFSVATGAQASAFVRVYKHREIKKGTFQYVLGSSPLEEFEAILRIAGEAKIPVTILGYKRVGRGVTFDPYPYNDWVKVLMKVWDFIQARDVLYFKDRDELRNFEGYEDRMYVRVGDGDNVLVFDSNSTYKERPGNLHGTRPKDIGPNLPGRWLWSGSYLGDDRVDVKVGIDTSVAMEFQDQISGLLRVPEWLYDVKEGLHSFYIDCVQHLVGPSSYGPDKETYLSTKMLGRFLDRIDRWEELKVELYQEFGGGKATEQWKDDVEEGLFE